MNKIHSIFKKTHKLLFSAVALILIICMLPTTALAADDQGDSLGVTRPNGGGNTVSNGYGKVVGDGAAWSSMADGKQSYLFMGYRVYMMDSTKDTLVTGSQVVDLIFDNASGSNFNKSNSTEWSTMYGNGSSSLSNRKLIKATNDINYITTVTSTDAMVVYNIAPNRSSTATAGNNFSTWMMQKSGNVTNAQKLMEYAFGATNTQDYIKNTNYYLMVEPLFISSIWSYREWVPFEETYTAGDIYIEHYLWAPTEFSFTSLISRQGMVYDYCCDMRSTHVTPAEIEAEYGRLLTLEPLSQANDHMFSTLIENSYDIAKKKRIKSFLSVVTDKLNLRDSSWKTKTWTIVWNDLTIQEKNQVYNYCVANNIDMLYGVEYPKTVIKGYKLNPVNPISYGIDSEGNKLYHYADYTVAYRNKVSMGWTRSHEAEGYHLVSAYTGTMLYGTYKNTIDYCSTLRIGNKDSWGILRGGLMGGDYPQVGDGFKTVTTNSELEIPAGTFGLHIYGMDIVKQGEPINTYDIDTNPTVPDESEQPSEPKQNTGTSNIIKVYGKVYRDDTGKYHYMEDYKTAYVTTNTTDEIIITDEYEKTGYTLTQWVVSSTKNTGVTATKWAKISPSYGLDYSTLKSTLGVTAYTMTSASKGLLHGEDNPLTIGEGNTIYLLYLKPLPPLETSDQPIPDTPDPNDTYPENPYNPTPKPDKQGSFNIIKVYAILDEYNGKVISSNTYPQQSTTPFIKIESTPESSTWTLAQWKVTNKYNQSITAKDWCGEATTEDQLKSFYLNHFYDISTTSTFGTTYGGLKGNTPSIYYFDTSGTEDTIYILFVKTNGDF